MDSCIFCKLVSGQIPANFVYQDDEIAVFPDIKPSADIHLIFIPKKHVVDLVDASDEVVVRIKNKILDKVRELDLVNKGYRVVVNGGAAKAINHLHFHLLGNIKAEREV